MAPPHNRLTLSGPTAIFRPPVPEASDGTARVHPRLSTMKPTPKANTPGDRSPELVGQERISELRRRYIGERSAPQVLVSAGLELFAAVGLLTLGGWWLDRQFETQPWLLLTGMSLGVVGGIYKMWRTGKRYF